MYIRKLLTNADIYIDVDSYDGSIYNCDTNFTIARVNGDTVEGVELDVKEAQRVAKQLNSFLVRVDKRMVTAKKRSATIRAKNSEADAK